MTDLDILKQMIKTSACAEVEVHYNSHKVVLSEPQCPDSKVEIRNIPADAIIIGADKFPPPNALFNGEKGECKRADYIIVAEKNNRICAVYIELKRTNQASATDIQKQLRGAHCVLCYLQAIGREFWGKQDFLANIAHRYIGFTHTGSIRKHKTRESRPSELHKSPEKFLKFSWQSSVEFNKITGKFD